VRELSLHILDIAENSIAAGAKNITVSVDENSITDLLKLTIADDGRGMSEEMVKKVIDPFVTSRTTRKVGLGIPLLKEAAEACNGSLEIASKPGVGTTISVTFQRSHIDRMPLGDIATTYFNLLVSNPAIHWLFTYQKNDQVFELDDAEIKATIGDVPLTDPEILRVIRELFETNINEVMHQN
jgi:hypothetical protein